MTAGSSCGEEREGGGVVTKADLIDEVTKYATMKKKDVTDLVEAEFNVMTDALKRHEKVQIVGFGTFEPRRRKARVGRDPADSGRDSDPRLVVAQLPSWEAAEGETQRAEGVSVASSRPSAPR